MAVCALLLVRSHIFLKISGENCVWLYPALLPQILRIFLHSLLSCNSAFVHFSHNKCSNPAALKARYFLSDKHSHFLLHHTETTACPHLETVLCVHLLFFPEAFLLPVLPFSLPSQGFLFPEKKLSFPGKHPPRMHLPAVHSLS